jgi:hypothetical protein
MKVSDAEFSAFDVNGEVDFAPAAQVLDVAVSAMFGTSWFIISMISMQEFAENTPGIVLAPSLPTFALISSEAEPAWTFVALGG